MPGGLFCSLDGATHVHVFSDYSAGPRYLTYSFMLADLARSQRALESLVSVRQKHGLGPRRMAYKGLNDSRKAEAVPEFVEAARGFHAHVLTFAVSRSIPGLFHRANAADMDPSLTQLADRYKAGGQEHLARVLHFFAFALAGMSSPGQHVDWVTDVDQVAPEQEWLAGLVELAANLSSHYLTHTLGDFYVATTRSDDGTRLLEDVCAIPDFFAGSVAESLSHQSVAPLSLPTGLIVPLAPTVRSKAVDILRRLTNRGPGSLRSTCIGIEPEGDAWRIQARYFHEMPGAA